MKRTQADRSVIAARAALRASRSTDVRVSRNPALRSATVVHATGAIRRSRAVSLTATQRNSEGKRSEWSASPEFFTDPKWGQTVGTQYTGGSW